MKIAVIGGGIFGVTAAFTLSKHHNVELFEKNNDILQAASGSNQYRVHRGYHYPRSKDTVLGIINSENSFKKTFAESIIKNFDHYYCIAKENSLTTAQEFKNFCNEFKLEFEESDLSFMNKDSISLSVKVKESVYDPEKLRKICWEKLNETNVDVRLNSEFTDELFEKYDKIVLCTYSHINNLIKKFPQLQREYQFELCEKPVVELPKSFQNKSVVIMDGPFMCIDPLANTQYHLLCNVVHEIHQSNVGKYPITDEKFAGMLDRGIIKNPKYTNFQQFLDSTDNFIPGIKDAKHIGSMFTVRAVPPRVEKTDARPTLVETINNKIISIFSGKITTCVEAAYQAQKLL